MADVGNELNLKVTHRENAIDVSLPSTATVKDLALYCADEIKADVERTSLFLTPKPGLIKSPFPEHKLSELLTPSTRIKVIGTPTKDVKKLEEMALRVQTRATNRSNRKPVVSSRNRDWKKIQEEATYTFHAIESLKYLPNPEKSKRFLERLANDPGIKASMRKHKFSVGLLTEMNPAEHTTHDGKTLGLNRNKGEVIELRLRTDRYDGYRDYKVIRKTLCHELSHNIWSEHDRNFWDLTKEIEKEVERNDWMHGGHKLSESEFYNPEDSGGDFENDFGGWVGGEFVLGRSTDSNSNDDYGLSRREIMARAALSRLEKQKDASREQEDEQKDV